VGEVMAEIEWGLRTLTEAFAKVVWVPGNHDLWTRSEDPVALRGEERYGYMVERCRELGVLTPEDEYVTWGGPEGPVTIVPLFTLFDYSFGRNVGATKSESLARAHEAGIVCSDEFLLFPDPHATIDDWCRERVRIAGERLEDELDGEPTVLVNHWPLIREPTARLMYPEFAQWCGTELTAGWHTRYNAAAVVYGHLHIPRTTMHDGVPFHEVSLGYPRQWARRSRAPSLRRVLPAQVPA
jgi:3',5'-cyclic AMP phosphodiesterase CpdA